MNLGKFRDKKDTDSIDISYSTEGFELLKAQSFDSGFDLKARVSSDVVIPPGVFRVVGTGLRLEIPAGFDAQIRPRSGLAANCGVTVLNSPGTVDSGYRGEVKVILINHGKKDFIVQNGDRIAQLVFSQVIDVNLVLVQSVDKQSSDRKEKGFGSSGRK